ncbi:type VI secretion system contractile sheath large subunit [Moritella sp.]|uniref:type VI secretion system contractile sheath domain-containing protein n=1 Tax=Moritella sp. TaxID=78556 RepID=UPI001DB7C1FC|nr:type VI secretion system contractile sheath large subunit [Moritella sp.]MCJ8349259.1 type VI secretion system contractile sheath large subunit [Moritella sp.]NQZ39547.1 type VI secretion system contractile sheath large subunit [Moritella sp.]
MSTSNLTSSANVLTDAGLWRMLLNHAQNDNRSEFKSQLSKLITQLDDVMSEQLSAVMQATDFKELEARWLGLHSLVLLPVSQRRVHVKLLDLSWDMVSADLNQSFNVTRSALYQKIYAKELDTAGGHPFGLLVVDHLIQSDLDDDADFDDLYTLQLLGELGERALCPVSLGVDPYFFGDEPARLMPDHKRIQRILSSSDLQSWQLLRSHSASRFLNLVLPEYHLRSPYQHCQAGFVFNERALTEHVLWGNAAYLLAANVIREFDRISWFGFLRAYDERGRYGAIVQVGNGQQEPLLSRIDLFSEDDEFWSEQGFVPLSSVYLSGQKGIFSNQSVWKATTETEKMSGMLQTNLMACRFGHYIKAQIRDQIGSFDSPSTCQRSLEKWLNQYISGVDFGDESVMARYPLKRADVNFTQDLLDPTKYRCQINLQPQYQYEMLDTHIVLLTDVPATKLGKQ